MAGDSPKHPDEASPEAGAAHGAHAHAGHDHDDHAHGHDAHGHGAHGHDDHGAHGAGDGHDAHGHDAHDADHGHGHGPELQPSLVLGPPRKLVDVGGGVSLATIDEGAGLPVLFLHGFPTSSAIWRGVIERLGPSVRAIAPDLLGFGDSEGPVDADLGIEAQAERALRLLDALEVESAVVVGHDWGGAVAQILAVDHPARVRALALIDTPCFDSETPPVTRWLCRAARVSAVFDLLSETGLLRSFAHSRWGMQWGAAAAGSLSSAFVESCVAPLSKETPPAYRAPRERFRRALLQVVRDAPSPWREVSPRLAEYQGPALVVWGCDDPYVSVSRAKQLADTLPNLVALELLAFVGHWVPEEAPERLTELLRQHLLGDAEAEVGAVEEAAAAAVG